ncbi:MAG: hypothetical protein DRP56_05555 [Planctomycetota bacterium]|nr:MAG: hypothetical protein DRP56_05555 [Planctomycetota bacterium]RKY14154.1 MAG: hypothetical protein DRP52_00850 [Planctomycetota bacterium]
MSFCTAINCMDGRIQLLVIPFLQTRFKAEFVDCITEPGPVRVFDQTTDPAMLKSILTRIDISVNHHGSSQIAVCAHPDCSGNPVEDEVQKAQLKKATAFLKETYPAVTVAGFWIESNQQPQEYC